MIHKTCLIAALLMAAGGARAERHGWCIATEQSQTEVTLAFGGQGEVDIDWGDGNVKHYKAGTVVGRNLGDTIRICANTTVTSFGCAAQNVTAINLNGASALLSIDCCDNQLTRLDLNGAPLLEELNCSNNRLSAVDVSRNPHLRALDCSGNHIESLRLENNRQLQILHCSDNRLTSVGLDHATDLRSLWADHNAIDSLHLEGQKQICSIGLSSNGLKELKLNTECELQDLWVDNNLLTTLNIGRVKRMETINVANNELTSIGLEAQSGMEVKTADYSNNRLALCYFFAPAKVANYLCGAQRRVPFGVDTCEVKTMIDVNHMLKNAGGASVGRISFYNARTGEVLVKGSNADTHDYLLLSGRLQFWHAIDSVYAVITSPKYPDMKIQTQAFVVFDPSIPEGISAASRAGTAPVVTVWGHTLTVSGDCGKKINVVSADGRLVWRGTLAGAPVAINVAPGVYLVNNRKIIVQ